MMFTEDESQYSADSYILNSNSSSFYEQMGAEEALAKISMLFHIKINNDELLSSYFATTEVLTQITQQRNFICLVLNGPIILQGDDAVGSFKSILNNRIAFLAMASHLKQSLYELEYDEMLIEEIMENLNNIHSHTNYNNCIHE